MGISAIPGSHQGLRIGCGPTVVPGPATALVGLSRVTAAAGHQYNSYTRKRSSSATFFAFSFLGGFVGELTAAQPDEREAGPLITRALKAGVTQVISLFITTMFKWVFGLITTVAAVAMVVQSFA